MALLCSDFIVFDFVSSILAKKLARRVCLK